jgi:hypothetical protein
MDVPVSTSVATIGGVRHTSFAQNGGVLVSTSLVIYVGVIISTSVTNNVGVPETQFFS